jgi:DNA-directed RNA polymerase specialized sigma24 family protein
VTKRGDRNLSHRGRTPREEPDYAALVRAAQTGSQAAVERLLMRAQEVAYRFSLMACGGADDAEDAMQEALLKTYRYATRIRNPEAFKTWLYRTVRNACLISRRRRVDGGTGCRSTEPLGGPGGRERRSTPWDPPKDPEAVAINARLRRQLAQALSLPAPCAWWCSCARWKGSRRETSPTFWGFEANVDALHRARLFLRRELEEMKASSRTARCRAFIEKLSSTSTASCPVPARRTVTLHLRRCPCCHELAD